MTCGHSVRYILSHVNRFSHWSWEQNCIIPNMYALLLCGFRAMSSQLRSSSAPPWAAPVRPASLQDHELLSTAHAFLQNEVGQLHSRMADMKRDLDTLERTFQEEKAGFVADNAALRKLLGNLAHRLHKVETRIGSSWLPDPEPEPGLLETPAATTGM